MSDTPIQRQLASLIAASFDAASRTRFEEQVAVVLSAWVAANLLSRGGPVFPTDPDATWVECQVRDLAPAIAAAIEAAIRDAVLAYGDGEALAVDGGPRDTARSAALRALAQRA